MTAPSNSGSRADVKAHRRYKARLKRRFVRKHPLMWAGYLWRKAVRRP